MCVCASVCACMYTYVCVRPKSIDLRNKDAFAVNFDFRILIWVWLLVALGKNRVKAFGGLDQGAVIAMDHFHFPHRPLAQEHYPVPVCVCVCVCVCV